MNPLEFLFRTSRRRAALVAALVAPALLTQCRTSVQSYEEIQYDPATLQTPAGHGMEKKEYPFDDDGNYRKDWVRNDSSGRTRSSYDLPEVEPEATTPSQEAGPRMASATDSTNSTLPAVNVSASDAPYPGDADETDGASPTSEPASAPVESSSASEEPSYHRVATGDTLFALARRYDTTVAELKRVNGLTGDTIREGQSLRVP